MFNSQKLRDNYLTCEPILARGLAELGHEVDHRKVTPGEDLSRYDVALLGIIHCDLRLTLNRTSERRMKFEHTKGMSSVESGTTNRKSRDILSSLGPALTVFWLPATAIAIAGSSGFSSNWRTIVWTVALGIMGIGCIANALRCGRVHCYISGPFFLVMGLLTLLYGLGVVPLGRNGWNLIGVTILVGSIALCCLLEMFLGKYRKGHAGDGNHC
jgi:hypothetical protein